MKSMVWILFICLSGFSSQGQVFRDTTIFNKFLGHWSLVNSTDTFELRLIKDTVPIRFVNSVTYNVFGFHRLIEKGIENSFKQVDRYDLYDATLLGGNLNDSTLRLIVIDKYRHRSYIVHLIIDAENNQIAWKKIKDEEPPLIINKNQRESAPKVISDKTIPFEMILNRVDK